MATEDLYSTDSYLRTFEAVVQREARGDTPVHLVMLIHQVQEGRMNAALAGIEALPAINGSVMRIRVESLGID